MHAESVRDREDTLAVRLRGSDSVHFPLGQRCSGASRWVRGHPRLGLRYRRLFACDAPFRLLPRRTQPFESALGLGPLPQQPVRTSDVADWTSPDKETVPEIGDRPPTVAAGGRVVSTSAQILCQVLADAYGQPGFDALGDDAFKALVLARIAHDRRRGRAVDPPLSVLTARGPDGSVQGSIAHFACHPVVIDGSSTLLSGDYPAALRKELERSGGTTLFLTGCAGDINTGHSAESSYIPTGLHTRTPAEAQRIGRRLAGAARAVAPRPLDLSPPRVSTRDVVLALDIPEREGVTADRAAWSREHETANPARLALLDTWIQWADGVLAGPDGTRDVPSLPNWSGRVSVLHLGELIIIALPGEPFLETADRLETAIAETGLTGATLVLGYADGVPGYLPPRSAYRQGGYEVADAHRYYAMPGPFSPGGIERLEAEVLDALSGWIGAEN